MGLLGTLIGTAVDVVTTPLDVLEDVVDVASGEKPTAVADKARELGKDVGQAVEDTTNIDLV